jgi:N-acetylmuramoyl-L-alanine amidase
MSQHASTPFITTGLRRTAAALLAVSASLLAGCASGGLQIDDRYRAASQDSRVQFIVLHYTEGDFGASLNILTQGPVSSHYLVTEDPPIIYRLVPEERRAYHAGASSWEGATALNASSVGIEVVNRGYIGDKFGPYTPYPEAQIDRVIALVKDIAQRHAVRPHRIIGHSDIAPTRKVDPGPMFPWPRLAAAGLVPWPDPQQVESARQRFAAGALPDMGWFQSRLAAHGFLVPLDRALGPETRDVLIAFQMKYRPQRYDGVPDAETAALLEVVTTPGGLLLTGPDGVQRPYTR